MRFEDLDRLGIEYEVLEHDPVLTCDDVVRVLNVPLSRVIKTLILTDGSNVFAVVTRGDKKVRSSDIKRIFGRKLSFLKPELMKELLNQPIGAISPLLLNVKIAVGEDLNTHDFVFCGTGSNTHTLKVRGKDLIKALSSLKNCTIVRLGD